ncbi:NosD domain-containing protein [Oceanithermus desulfurans]|uniref:Copper-binding periplasmic protein n=2 Tax=Oceanithermus desulfurans TaxID=227924 RepID=A0A511RGW1_9DEIN|nr:NosD domain-containing protein [Oceanithermus desulfurans]MBB6028845.1 nitrous oxidase accessory protein [Oceanithermus desulfurans]GEM88904.1 copper-binding periplasmic protein [Oceanithermus desulfurans NBRC 100063]
MWFLFAAALLLQPGDPLPPLEPGDTLTLAPGVHAGPWTIEVPHVRLVAEPGAVLDGGGAGSALLLAAEGTSVEGLEVRNVGRENDFYAPDAAVWLVDCTDCAVRGLKAAGVTTGVRAEDSPRVRVEDCTLHGLGDAPGITLYRTPGARVQGNRVEGFLDGLYLEHASDSRALGNVSRESRRYGFHLMFSRGVEVAGNRVEAGRVGSAIMYGSRAWVHDNVFAGHVGPLAFGLLVQEQSDSRFERNRVSGNTVGMLVVSSPDDVFRENDLINNGFGVLVRRERDKVASALRFEGNRFRGNVYDLAVDDPEAQVAMRRNRYDRVRPLDLDGDGAADLPYVPSSSYALLTSRQPDLSLFALGPGMLLWERVEGRVPALRFMTLADAAPLPLEREGRPFAGVAWILALAGLGGGLWLRS